MLFKPLYWIVVMQKLKDFHHSKFGEIVLFQALWWSKKNLANICNCKFEKLEENTCRWLINRSRAKQRLPTPRWLLMTFSTFDTPTGQQLWPKIWKSLFWNRRFHAVLPIHSYHKRSIMILRGAYVCNYRKNVYNRNKLSNIYIMHVFITFVI